MKVLSGKVGAKGSSAGTACVLTQNIAVEKRNISDVNCEINKLNNSVIKISNILESKKNNVDKQTSDIIDAQINILNDCLYLDRITNKINNEHVCAEFAVYVEGNTIADELSNVENEYLKERSDDIRGITQMLANELKGNQRRLTENDTIIVSDEVTPDVIVSADIDKIKGIVSKKGSKTTHLAIICGNLGIPYIYDIDTKGINQGSILAIDGENSKLYINPDSTIKDKISEMINATKNMTNVKCNSKVKIMANIDTVKEALMAMSCGADGIGLYRTEFLYMGSDLPSEDEQFEVYKEVAKIAKDKKVIIRTMDIGADKKSECLSIDDELNPALGLRGIRFSLEHPEIFRTQLKAIMRAAYYGNVNIMYPMITSVRELCDIGEQIKTAKEELNKRGVKYAMPMQGIVIETPAAVMLSDILMDYVDFASIGTNDLMQYTLAYDRLSDNYDRIHDPNNEAVMRMVEIVVNNAHGKGKSVGICGELGADLKAIPRLYQIGIDEFSVAASNINTIKKAINEID